MHQIPVAVEKFPVIIGNRFSQILFRVKKTAALIVARIENTHQEHITVVGMWVLTMYRQVSLEYWGAGSRTQSNVWCVAARKKAQQRHMPRTTKKKVRAGSSNIRAKKNMQETLPLPRSTGAPKADHARRTEIPPSQTWPGRRPRLP